MGAGHERDPETGNARALRVMLAGSGAVRANPRRGGPCQVVEWGGTRLIIDCGRCAAANLARFGCAAETITHVLVTHLHFDHVCDLPYLILLSWNNGRSSALPVFGPEGLSDFLEHAVRRAYAVDIASRTGHGKSAAGLWWECTEIGRDGTDEFRIAGAEIAVLRTPHAGLLNLNYRIGIGGRRIVITSDTQPSPALVGFCRDADLLVCECSGTPEFLGDKPWGGWHMTPEAVAGLVREAGVRHTVLKHFVIEDFPGGSGAAECMAAETAERSGAPVAAGYDGWSMTFPFVSDER